MVDGHDRLGRFLKGCGGRPKGSPNKWRPPGARKRQRYGDGVVPLTEREAEALHRFHSLLNDFTRDLGGEDTLSTGETQLARRCALISLACEDMEKKAIVNRVEQINLGVYATLTGHLGKALKTLGIQREPRGPTLQAHIASKAREQQQRLSEARDLVLVEEIQDEDLADKS